MPTKTKSQLEYLTIGVEVKTGIVHLKKSSDARGLSKLERDVFAVGADTVQFDNSIYKKVEDEALYWGETVVRMLSYELKR